MKKENDIDNIIGKVTEMRDFFKFGGEIIPFLIELFHFLRETIPLMVEANTSIRDSILKLPTASEKISTVSQNMEVATQQIMDKLDQITEKLDALSGTGQESSPMQDGINEIQNDVFDIMNALQFQDITAQQLEHANRILMAMDEKFKHLFKAVSNIDVSNYFQKQLQDQFLEAAKLQKIKDNSASFHNETEDVVHKVDDFSQDDIDNLFG